MDGLEREQTALEGYNAVKFIMNYLFLTKVYTNEFISNY